MYSTNLEQELENILSFDEIKLAKDTIQDKGEMFFSIEVNDHSFLYNSQFKRDSDYRFLETKIKHFNEDKNKIDNLISNELLYSAMMAINKAPNTKMAAFKDTYDVGTRIKEHLLKIGFLDADKIKNFNF